MCRTSNGIVEVLVIHRPGHDDWSFPKGKVEDDESDEECALREVREETGIRCRLGRELLTTRYHDGSGRSKAVRYWLMEPVDGDFVASREVDRVVWLSPEQAAARLTYARDADVLEEAALTTSYLPPSR